MEISAFSLSKQFSDLMDRHVAVAEADSPNFTDRVVYACYKVLPNQGMAIVKLDLALLGALAGTMIGLPPANFSAQIQSGQLDDNLLDASREIMNILSPVLGGEGRAVFGGIFTAPAQHSREAEQLWKGRPAVVASFRATLAGKPLGFMTLVSDG